MIEEIKEQLKNEVGRMSELPPEEIDEDTPLTDLGIDSLMALELLVMLERTYHIEIAQEELRHFTSVRNVAELTETLIKGEPVAL